MASETEILGWLDQREADMVALLEEIVNIDSGSFNKAGVDAVQTALQRHLDSHGIACETIPEETFGNCMRAVVSGGAGGGNRPILLMGHCDTVFPDGTAAERPFHIENGRAYGPGVADMKAGLVINTFVLEAFARAGAPVPLVGLYTADEEIASPSSRPVIEAEAAGARAVLNAEPGRPNGNVVTARNGAMFLDIEITGKAAHSGVAHREGISAIEALCRKVPRLHALTDYAVGTTVNVGTIQAGTTVNTVAERARAGIDVRFRTIEAMIAARSRLMAILEAEDLPGTRTAILSERAFLPVTPSAASLPLFETYVAAAAELGMAVEGEFSGGSADSGFTAALGTPTLCATGPVGGKPHTADEYMDVASLVPRAKALALTILKLAEA